MIAIARYTRQKQLSSPVAMYCYSTGYPRDLNELRRAAFGGVVNDKLLGRCRAELRMAVLFTILDSVFFGAAYLVTCWGKPL
jgi:hypothetical protein